MLPFPYPIYMSLAKKIAYNTLVQVLGKVLSTAIGIVIVGMLTRRLGTDGFGLYSAAIAYLQIFALLLDLGLNVTLVAMLGEHAGDDTFERRCTSAIFTLRICMALLILGVAPLIWTFLYPGEATMHWVILALSGSFFFPALNQVVVGVQQRHLKMTATAIGENIGRVIVLAALLLAKPLNLSLVDLMWAISIGSAANFFYNIWQARKLSSFTWNWDPEFWKLALKRSWPIGVSIAFNLVYFKADTLILSRVRPLAETGLYGAAYRVLEILVTIPFIYAGIILPLLSSQWAKKQKAQFVNLISHSIDLMMLLICPMIAGTIALGPELMAAIAGEDFRQAGNVLQVLMLAVGAIYINTIFSHAVVAINAQKRMLPVYIAVAIGTLAGYLLLIPKLGMYGAAWLTVASEAVIMIGNIAITTKNQPLKLAWRPSFAAITASLAMILTVFPFRNYPLPIPLLIGVATYLALVFLLGGVTKEMLKQIMPNKAKEIEPLP